jgi:integrase
VNNYQPPSDAAPVRIFRFAATLSEFLTRWLADVVKPNLEPMTYAYYEAMVRLYIIPGLGSKHLDGLQTQDVQNWLNELPGLCQCCIQGKDVARPERRRRCCMIGAYCRQSARRRTIQAARHTLHAALRHAIASGELASRNVAGLATLPRQPRAPHRPNRTWSPREAIRFLTAACDDEDPLYAARALVLVNALFKGEVLGLTWPSIDLDHAELQVSWQLQRVGKHLIHNQRTTPDDDASTLPLPDICIAALKHRRSAQDAARDLAGDRWQPSDLVLTTQWGTPGRAEELQPQLRHPLRQSPRAAHPPARHPAHLHRDPGRTRSTPEGRDAHPPPRQDHPRPDQTGGFAVQI